jgi:hypothetical protein
MADRVRSRVDALPGGRLAGLIAAGGGLALVVVGTFLPWLRTGLASRNSFRAAGLIRRLLDPPGFAGVLLAGWPFVVLTCAVGIALLALGFRRTGLILAAAVAATAGAVAITTLLLPSRSYAAVARSGPAVTAAGAGLVLVAVVVGLVRGRGATRRRAGASGGGVDASRPRAPH